MRIEEDYNVTVLELCYFAENIKTKILWDS